MFGVALVVWVVLCWPPDVQHVAVGVVVAAFIALAAGDLLVRRPHILRNPVRYWYFCFIYVPVFLWECLKANLDVAYRVLSPHRPIRPGIVRVKTSLKSDAALTFLANSITLTPGTMTVDVDKEQGILYVHWIDVKDGDIDATMERVAGRFEYILERIFE